MERMNKPDTTRLRCHCGARCVAYHISVETYSQALTVPWPLGRVAMHWEVRCERGHRQEEQPAQLSLFEVTV